MRWQPTSMTGRRIAWLGIAILAGVGMLFLQPLERDPGVWAPRTSLRLTSDQVMTLLGRNGWHILRTADGMLLLVSEGDRTTLLAPPSPVRLPVPPGLPPPRHPPSRSAARAPDGTRPPE